MAGQSPIHTGARTAEGTRKPAPAGLLAPASSGDVSTSLSASLMSPALLASLQRSVGNQAVAGMLARRQAGHDGLGAYRVPLALRAGTRLPAAPSAAAPSAPSRTVPVQRHSSWEHSLLGDAKPEALANIGSAEDLMAQKPGAGAKAEVDVPGVGKLTKGNVMHTLAQEMGRVKDWQTAPPTATSTADPFKPVAKDPEYQVVVVALPTKGGKPPLLITYGELNTLADYFGDFETMKNASPTKVRQLVQSVRKETFLRLKGIYDKLEASLGDAEKTDENVTGAQDIFEKKKLGKASFSGAMTPDFISGVKGQADLLAGDKPLIGQGTGAKGKTSEYGATLARNACHFAPESWHSWADYHAQARAKATAAYQLYREARAMEIAMNDPETPATGAVRAAKQRLLDGKKAESAAAANEALLLNGFGDHYLQDSYASGHMLNKTQIMQWYVEYIDSSKEWDYFKDKNWRKVQQMAYRQGGLADAAQYDKTKVKGAGASSVGERTARSPQAVETHAENDWLKQFEALGLSVPASLRTPGSPERQVTEFLQLKGMKLLGSRTITGAALLADGPIRDQAALETACKNLILDGILRTDEANETRGSYMSWGGTGMAKARFSNFKQTKLILRDDYVPKNKKKFKAALAASKAPGKEDDSEYQRMAASVTYGDYFMFMKSAFIQKATNALHDVFCKSGLTVSAGAGGELFKVYGDDAMFSQESAKGVKFSGETSNMSRDSIIKIIDTGADGGITTASILERLPDHVQYTLVSTGKTVTDSIATWHSPEKRGALKDRCMSDIFPGMAWEFMQKFVPGVVGGELGTISKDEAKHGSDAF